MGSTPDTARASSPPVPAAEQPAPSFACTPVPVWEPVPAALVMVGLSSCQQIAAGPGAAAAPGPC